MIDREVGVSEELTSAPHSPEGPDLDRPAASRMYDYYIGGFTWWQIDKHAADKVLERLPVIRPLAKSNRQWLLRVVEEAIAAGVTQFVDIGCGIVNTNAVHQVAGRLDPDSRVVYVDNEEVAYAHAQVTLETQHVLRRCQAVRADVRETDKIVNHEKLGKVIDLDQPVCVLMAALLHFIGPDDNPRAITESWKDRLAPGSWLAISHLASDETTGATEHEREQIESIRRSYRDTTNPLWVRSYEEVAGLFDGWNLLEPGVVNVAAWRNQPTEDADDASTEGGHLSWCGVAEKP